MPSKKQVAIALSKLKAFEKPKEYLEQYATDGNVAADLLWNAYQLGDIVNKDVVDYGAGTGILSIGALLLGAKHATLIDIDKDALEIAKQNLDSLDLNAEIKHQAIGTTKADTIIMNPPFGAKNAQADKGFLTAAMQSAPVIYSMHNDGSQSFLRALTKKYGYKVTHEWKYSIQLKKTFEHHKQPTKHLPIIAVRIEKVL